MRRYGRNPFGLHLGLNEYHGGRQNVSRNKRVVCRTGLDIKYYLFVIVAGMLHLEPGKVYCPVFAQCALKNLR